MVLPRDVALREEMRGFGKRAVGMIGASDKGWDRLQRGGKKESVILSQTLSHRLGSAGLIRGRSALERPEGAGSEGKGTVEADQETKKVG